MTTVYQLCSSRYKPNSGVGASLYGGPWNPVGTAAINTVESPSLAALEVLVHFSVLPCDFTLTEIVVPGGVGIVRLDEDGLPFGWNNADPIAATQELGQRWFDERRFAALSVPSSIVPGERNYVLNPAHSSFHKIVFKRSVPFRFDPRLK